MDVGAWLRGLGLGQYERAFRENDIDADLLARLTAEDLKEVGVSSVGHRRRLLDAAAALRSETAHLTTPAAGLLASAASRSSQAGAERRQLTVMFVDLVGSTQLSRRLDPEEMSGVLRAYQDAVAGATVRFGGHVAEFLGDGVLCFFGWPRAQEGAAEQAVRAALALIVAVSGLTEPGGESLACRVGIATGLVVVGELIGQGAARVGTAVGETLNLAARLQAAAGPGEVVVSGMTRRLLGGLFRLEPLTLTNLKGFEGAGGMAAFRVLGEGWAEGRFKALRGPVPTPLVGRERELAVLLDGWAWAKEGRGQVVQLCGEPGIGKSRLVQALCERVAAEPGPHTRLLYQCAPHQATSALWPVVEQLGRAAGIARDELPEANLDRLETLLGQAAVADVTATAAPLIADLLGLPAAGRYPPRALTPRQRKELTFKVLLAQLKGLAAERPVLVVLEDAHWSDPTSLELFERVVTRIKRLPVLLVVTFRPEFSTPWADEPRVASLTLGRFDAEQAQTLAERVAGGRALPAEILSQVVAKADGVPLFLEELTKTALEAGLLAERDGRYLLNGPPLPAVVIPSTLSDSLMARLDWLAPAKEVAQVAAVIGREFSHELLAAIAGLGKEELRWALARLVEAELVLARGEPGPKAVYSFKHALVRDAAYESLLKSRRHQLHARIAAVLEEQRPETKEVQPELLAHHYAGAGLAERAVNYWRRAAERAIRRFANLEAIAHCNEAVAQLRTLPPSSERVRAELEVQLTKGVAVRAGRGYSVPESEQVFLRACELCEELGDRVCLVHALRGLFGFYYVAARWPDAAQVADRICAAAAGLEDRVALCIRWTMDGAARLFRGEPAEAVARLREALCHYDEGDCETHIQLTGHEMASLIRFHLAIAEWFVGLPERAARTSEEAMVIAQCVTQPFSLAQALGNSALLRILLREWDTAEALAAETLEVSVRHGIPDYIAFGGMLAGTVIAARGDATKGAALARKGMAGLRRTGWQCFVPILLVYLTAALGASGKADAALEMGSEALRMARANGELVWEAEALRVLGGLKLVTGTASAVEVEADLRTAVDIAERQGAKAFQLRAATSLARFWAGRGRRREARDLLAPIYGRFTEGLGTPDLKDAKALLEELAPIPAASVA